MNAESAHFRITSCHTIRSSCSVPASQQGITREITVSEQTQFCTLGRHTFVLKPSTFEISVRHWRWTLSKLRTICSSRTQNRIWWIVSASTVWRLPIFARDRNLPNEAVTKAYLDAVISLCYGSLYMSAPVLGIPELS